MSKLTIGSKLAYGTGSMAFAVKDVAFGMFVLLFYTQVLGLSGALTGLAIFLSVMWDAVSDPMIGAWSDRLKTRWGRRHPMMLAGGIPFGLSFVLLFHPIEAVLDTQWLLFCWLLMSVVALRTFLTVFIIPHTAMGAEISDDYYERTSIVSFRTNLGWLAGILLPAVTLTLLFATADGKDGRFIVENYHRYGWVSCFVVIIVCTFCALGTQQFIPRLKEVASRHRPTPGFLGMMKDAVETFGNINFRRLVILDIAVGATMGILGALNMIAWTYFWELTVQQIALLSIASLIAVVVIFPTMSRMANRWQKQHLLIFAVAGLAINTAWFVPGRLLGWLPENGTTLLFAIVFVQWMINTAFTIVRTVANHSIMADIADEHELKTGRRQEGVFFAAAAFAQKFVMGFGYMIGGPLLDVVGLETGMAPGEAPASALLGIGIVIGPVMALLLMVPWWMATKLDVSRERLQEVQNKLDDRKLKSAQD